MEKRLSLNLEETGSLTRLCEVIFEHCRQKNPSVKQDVINRFLTSLYNSYRSFQKLLVDEEKYTDSIVIARRIIEIYIRTEYLKKYNLFALYDKMKYLERAEILRRLMQSNRPKYVETTTLWKTRNKIIKKNKEVRDELNKKKYQRYKINNKGFPSIEEMSELTGLTYLYRISYGTWSKFVHCNASLEGFIKYEDNAGTQYMFGNESEVIGEDAYMSVLNTVNYCVYEFLKSIVDSIKLGKEDIEGFGNNYIKFKIFDIYTGKSSSNYDFMKSWLEAFNIDKVDESWFEGVEEEHLIRTQKKDFDNTKNGKYITLEDMVKRFENELNIS